MNFYNLQNITETLVFYCSTEGFYVPTGEKRWRHKNVPAIYGHTLKVTIGEKFFVGFLKDFQSFLPLSCCSWSLQDHTKDFWFVFLIKPDLKISLWDSCKDNE